MFGIGKGQMSAPFELFVAVIIMGFVILIGTGMLDKVNDQVCLNSIDKQITDFKLYLEETANKKSSTKFGFWPDNCFQESKAGINIQKKTSTTTCAAKCGKPTDSCFVIQFYSAELAGGFKEKCLNLPTYTSFYSDGENCFSSISAEDLDGYDAIDPMYGGSGDEPLKIRRGSYVIRNISAAGEVYPKICVYYHAG